ncbi:MAG: sugar phosphate isomerase/epimerase family protein [Planctomycetota bacterium]
MLRLSINELTTYRWSFEEDLLFAREAGYQGIGVWLRKLRDFGAERAIELVHESGLTVSNVSWEGGFTGRDVATAEENIASARDTLDLCAELGAECLVVYSGARNGHTQRHANRLLRSALDQLLPHADRTGVALAVEPMHAACADGWTFLTGLPETLRLAQEYETPALRLALDTYHFPVGEADWPLLRELAPYLAVLHLGDLATPHGLDHARVPLGKGRAPLTGILQSLIDGGYDGFCDVKLIGPEIECLDYHELLDQSRRVFDELDCITPARSNPAPMPACNATSLSTTG